MIHLNNLEAEIYKLEKELETAIMNNREWDIQHLRSEIRDLERELENQYN